MSFIQKYKPILITSALMLLFVIGLFNVHLISEPKLQSEILMEISEDLIKVPDEKIEEEEKEDDPKESEQKKEQSKKSGKKTHRAYNEEFEDHTAVEQRIKSLLQQAVVAGDQEVTKLISPTTVDEKEEKKPVPKEMNNQSSSTSWSLKGRTLIGNIPNPVYTCNASGKVVLKIEVNANGYVMQVKIDKKKSTTRNACLFDNAIKYAQRALFSSSKIQTQKGTITYFFDHHDGR